MYLSNSINGNWQSDKDMDHRRDMIQNIVILLKQRDKNSSPEWLNKLPQMVKQLEVSLYRSAPSFEAYADKSTLKHRLQLLAMEIAKKTNQQGDESTGGDSQGHRDRDRDRRPGGMQNNQSFREHGGSAPNGRPGSYRHGGQGGQTNSPPGSNRMLMPDSRQNNNPWSRQSNDQGPVHRDKSSTNNQPQIVNIGQINDMMNSKEMGPPTPAVGPSSMSINNGSKNNGPGSTANTTSSDKRNEDWKIRIRHKQQRLLLLHHSSKCQVTDGTCKVTPHCADMKRLWDHMAKCEDNRCQVPHCYSSRAILSHYRKCKDPECQACGPVRADVWKQRSKEPTNRSFPHPSSKPRPLSPRNNGSVSGINGSVPPPELKPSSNPSVPLVNESRQPLQVASGGYNQKSVSPAFSSEPINPPQSRQPDNDEQGRIKHKQQRLLLLRHASKCEAKPGECKKTPHCAEMKKLWKHISECHDKNCTYRHCLSSRYVLMHYRRCKDAKCPSCAPVRATYSQKPPVSPPPLPPLPLPPPVSSVPPPKKSRPNEPVIEKLVNERKPVIPEPKPPAVVVSKPSNEELSYSLINNFTIKQIELHLKSLNQTNLLPLKTMKEKCQSVLKITQDHEYYWVFSKPVDPEELGLPDYFDVIKKPMDLGTVQKKLDAGQYHSINEFNLDVRLTFDNALMYNEAGSVVNGMAVSMKEKYVEEFQKMLESLKKEEEERKKNTRACALCGYEKLQFEPPVFFCNNIKCSSKRIHRNRHFYVGGNNQYNYCNQCYNELDAEAPIEMPDMTLNKKDLKKKKNDEVHEENWVQCDVCDRWIHQICGLFNSRQNKDNRSKYSCPKCLLEQRKKGALPTKANAPTAEDLPRTKLTEWLEKLVKPKVQNHYQVLAQEKKEIEKISYEEAYNTVSNGGNITIRQVTSIDRKLEVKEKMRKHYAQKNYPEEFPYRCKCILVFQNIDGADVILFALYVYEHGKENPSPNHRTVYISYLDSVHYMRPRKLRTFVYHEILIAYLEYARQHGFAKAHIWACPPLKGDDYIFYAKPEDQKTPKDKMLTKWYIDMLVEAQKRSIVGKVTNMYDLYFAPGIHDATAVPYLEGDYFSSEIESIIKDLEDGKGSKSKTGEKKSKKKKGGDTSKSKLGRKGSNTRSGGLDDSALGAFNDSNSNSTITRDPVMVKLGERIKDMKQSFIVAFLNYEEAPPADREVPQAIIEERAKRKLYEIEPQKDSNKRDAHGNMKSSSSKGSSNVIDDDGEEISGEIFDTRQDFLNLCKGNHYQFDAPRRAKHTSMMVLWHLHNKNAAKFIQSCIGCTREILSGVRYTCTTCTDIDLCAECYKNPKISRGSCTHTLVPKAVETDSNQTGSNSNLTKADRLERQRNINLHIKLLEHASLCDSANCNSSNCAKMKQYLKHCQTCKDKMAGGCKICKRIWTLLRYHAQSCKNRSCTIPQCQNIRERIRQIAKQQQAMDDRRRQMINRQYRDRVASN